MAIDGASKVNEDMIKRIFDLVTATTLVLLASPILLAVAIAVRVKLGGPVLYRQQRPGLGGQPFMLMKFRSMLPPGVSTGDVVADEMLRLTPFGHWLRNSSLDELPSLLNVIRGEMSLVGPRPLLMKYLPLYSRDQMRRHDVRPGLTGWAQVNGRSALSWQRKFELDLWYVDHRSFWLDLRILVLTAIKVVRREGVTPDSSALMPNFTGAETDYRDRNELSSPRSPSVQTNECKELP